MRLFFRVLKATLTLSGLLVRSQTPVPTDARGWLNLGIQQYKSAQYAQSEVSLQKAVDLDPSNPQPHLYLGTAYMTQYIPGAESPENLGRAASAESEFRRVLDLDGRNTIALASLASLAYQKPRASQTLRLKTLSWRTPQIITDGSLP